MKKTLHVLCFLLFSFLHGIENNESFPEIPDDFAFSQLNIDENVVFNHYCWSCFTGFSERWVFQFSRTNQGLDYTIWESPSERMEDYREDNHPNKVLLGTGSIDQQQLTKLDKFMVLSRDGDKCESQCWSEIKIRRNSIELLGIFHDIKDRDVSDTSIISFSDLIRSFEPNNNDGFYFDNRPEYSNAIHQHTVSDWKKIEGFLGKFEQKLHELHKDIECDSFEATKWYYNLREEMNYPFKLVFMINAYLEEIEDVENSNIEALFSSIHFVCLELGLSKWIKNKYEKEISDRNVKRKLSEAFLVLEQAVKISDEYENLSTKYKK